MNLVKIISSEINNLSQRILKILRFGKDDVQTAIDVSPFGIDSNPVKDMVAVYSKTGVKGGEIILGYINRNQLAAVGELRLYSFDSNGAEAFYTWIKNDGTIEIGGNADNLARFSALKIVIEEIQNDISSLKQAFSSWTPVAMDGGAALKTTSATWAGTTLQESIDDAKIDEIKIL